MTLLSSAPNFSPSPRRTRQNERSSQSSSSSSFPRGCQTDTCHLQPGGFSGYQQTWHRIYHRYKPRLSLHLGSSRPASQSCQLQTRTSHLAHTPPLNKHELLPFFPFSTSRAQVLRIRSKPSPLSLMNHALTPSLAFSTHALQLTSPSINLRLSLLCLSQLH